ncbi:MAG: AMP-binding protein [Planctomycetales bacterium]|nr:AMP-binding protein [Planctomycetales bacterium]
MQLEQFLERSAAAHPDKVAIICGDRRLTYADIESQCNRLAHGLIAEGVQRGDRVGVYLDNTVESVLSVWAILKAGAVFMMVNPTTKSDKLSYVLNNSRATALILPRRKLNTLGDVWPETPHLKSIVTVGVGPEPMVDAESGKSFVALDDLLIRHADDSQPPRKRCIDIDLAALIYTSGSTGNPKGVMLTHLNMVSAATSITTYLENRHDDIVLNVLPLSFDYGLYQVLMAFKFGGTVVLERGFTYPHAVLETVVRERVTGLPLVPTMLAILLQMDLSKYDFSHLRYVTNTAAALPVEHIRQLRQLLPHVTIYSMYGLTECKRVSYLPPDQIDIRPASVGRGMPNEEVYVVDDQGRRLGGGEVGELVVRGANVMKGYWELPDETNQRLKPGPLPNEMQLHTGDLFRADDEGYLYFVGRKDDIIKSRGEKVAPREVENVLCNHPAVAEAAVIGIPDLILGQSIKAVVTIRPGADATERDLLRHCAANLEDFMVPQVIEIRESLPKTGNGKVNKRELAGVTEG